MRSSDAMQELASAPGGCWKLARVRLHGERQACRDGSVIGRLQLPGRTSGQSARADGSFWVVARVVETSWTGSATRDAVRRRDAGSSADAGLTGLDGRDERAWMGAGLLITQRSRVQIPPPLPRPEAPSRTEKGHSACGCYCLRARRPRIQYGAADLSCLTDKSADTWRCHHAQLQHRGQVVPSGPALSQFSVFNAEPVALLTGEPLAARSKNPLSLPELVPVDLIRAATMSSSAMMDSILTLRSGNWPSSHPAVPSMAVGPCTFPTLLRQTARPHARKSRQP
jgi:hypothetical protein